MINLVQRSLTGILFSLLMVLSVLWHEATYVGFFVLVIVLAGIEYYYICRKLHTRPIIAWQISLSLFLFIASYLFFRKIVPISALGIIIPLFYFVFITELYRRKRRAIQNIAMTFLPVVHVGVPLALLNGLVFLNGTYDYKIVLGLTFLVWINDSMAYAVGMLIGKNRIMPKVSPKKSWEGFVGGAISAGVLSVVLADQWSVISVVDWVVLGGIVVVFGLLGDLVESMLKRNAGIKDSGNVLPGHGGVLDRFDGFLFVIPFAFAYLYMIH